MRMTNSMNKARQCFEARGKAQLDPAGIPAGEICFRTVMSGRKAETANSKLVSQQLHASKGTTLPVAIIDGHTPVSRCMERTLLIGNDLAVIVTEGCHPMQPALNRRNPGITEEVGKSSRRQKEKIRFWISEWPVNWRVSNPVQVQAKAGARSLRSTGCRLRLVLLLTEYW